MDNFDVIRFLTKRILSIEWYQNYPNWFRFRKDRTKYLKVGLNFLEVDYLNFHKFSKSEPILIIFIPLDSAPSKTPGGIFLGQNSFVFPCFWKGRKSFDAKNSSAMEFQVLTPRRQKSCGKRKLCKYSFLASKKLRFFLSSFHILFFDAKFLRFLCKHSIKERCYISGSRNVARLLQFTKFANDYSSTTSQKSPLRRLTVFSISRMMWVQAPKLVP